MREANKMAERPPLSSFEERPSLSSFEDGDTQSEGAGVTALDVAKQIPSGLVTGLEAIPAAPAQILGAVGRAANYLFPGDPEAEAQQQKMREVAAQQRGQGIANYLPAPQTTAGQYARTAAEFVPSAAGAPGSLATNIGAGIVGGLASEAAGQATAGTELEMPARMAGAFLGMHGYQSVRQRLGRVAAYHGAPAQADLERSVDTRYGDARKLGVQLSPTSTSEALQGIRKSEAIDEILAPKTDKLLEKYANQFSPETGITEGVSFDQIETLRRKLSKLSINKLEPSEAEGARDAVRGIDNFLAGIKPEDVLAGDATKLASIAKTAREEAAANFRMKAIDALRERAELSAGKGLAPERAYRNELASFVRPDRKGVSPAMREGFTKPEIAEMKKASKVTSLPGLLRTIGIAGGYLGMAGLGGASLYTHDPQFAEAAALGYGARKLGGVLARARANQIARMTASRSPLAREMGVRIPVPAVAPNWAATASVLGRPSLYSPIQGPAGFKKGGRVTKSFRYSSRDR